MAKHSEQLADLWVRAQCAAEGVLNMHVAMLLIVVAIVIGFAAPTSANDRPSDPFGNHTVELNKEARLVEIWDLNRSINLMIKAAPGDWTGPLEAITMRNGDCKAYSIAKYAAGRVAGFSADHVRLVIVHDRRHFFDHMVAAVYQNQEWLILDNLTNLLLRDSEKRDYEPTAILDYKGVRRYPSAFWIN